MLLHFKSTPSPAKPRRLSPAGHYTVGQSLISLRCQCWSAGCSWTTWFQEQSPALFPNAAASLCSIVHVQVEKTRGYLLILLPLSLEVWKNPLSLSLSNILHSWYHKRPLRDVSNSIPILHIEINLASLVGTNFLINGSLIFFFLRSCVIPADNSTLCCC